MGELLTADAVVSLIQLGGWVFMAYHIFKGSLIPERYYNEKLAENKALQEALTNTNKELVGISNTLENVVNYLKHLTKKGVDNDL